MPKAPYRRQMRDSMIAIAARIVATEGLSAVQARRVAQEAGCAVGTLYNVFGGLDFLIIEANATTLDALRTALGEADTEAMAGPPGRRLLALALAYLHFANERSHAWRAVFEHHMLPGVDVPSWYRERQAALFGMVESILRDAVGGEAPLASSARALFAAVHGIVTIALDRKLGDFDLAETERQVKFVVTAIAAGLARGDVTSNH
jgi:AcrR family transcriptional regulator